MATLINPVVPQNSAGPLGYRPPRPRPGVATKPGAYAPPAQGINGGNPWLRGQQAPAMAGTPAPLPSGLPSPVGQVTPQGRQGLSAMGIPAPADYTPRPLASGAGTATTGYGTGGSMTPLRDAAQAAVDRYTGGVQYTSNPVTPGSAWNGGIGGPSATAALNAWQLGQNNAQMLQSFGYRGEQMATNDYAPGGAMYRPPVSSVPQQAGAPAAGPAQGSVGTAPGGGSPVNPSQPGAVPASGISASSLVGNNPNLAGIANSYDQAQIDNTTANEQRYRDILSGYGSQYDRLTGMQQGLGEAERTATNRRYDAAQGRNLQDAISRGLTGTTVLPGLRTMTERDRTQSLGELDERLRRERINLDQGISDKTLGFMERREDTGPDLNQLIALAQAMGQGGDGSESRYGGLRGVDLSPQFVSNGMDGGQFGQPLGYRNNQRVAQPQQGNAAQMAAQLMAMYNAQQQGSKQKKPAAAQYDKLRYTPMSAVKPAYRGDVNRNSLAAFANYV